MCRVKVYYWWVVMLIRLILVVLFSLSVCTHALAKANVTTTAKCSSLYTNASDPCSFTLSGDSFAINPDGKGLRTANGKQVAFSVRVPGQDSITVLHYGVYQGDLVLVYETEDGESSASYIVRLDGNTLDQKWEVELGGFNTATGLIQSGYLYQTAIGLVAKLNLASGKFDWIHKDLYDRAYFSFNSFETPQKQGEKIFFKEVVQSDVAYDLPRTIVVSDVEGGIRVDRPKFRSSGDLQASQ